MYEYFCGKRFLAEEHMLYQSEIAARYHLYSYDETKKTKGSPHARLVGAILRDYEIQTHLNIREYYVETAHGLSQVYPKALWEEAMEHFIEQYVAQDSPKQIIGSYVTKENGKTIRFSFLLELNSCNVITFPKNN